MKLLKSLIPVASIGCVAATVVPCTTSCGSNTYYFDGKQIYVPDIETAKMDKEHIESLAPYDENVATALYFEHLAENPEIFKQDMLCCLSSTLYHMRFQEKDEYKINPEYSLNINYKNIVINKSKQTISFTCWGSGKFTFSARQSNSGTTDISSILDVDSFELEIQNLPVLCDWLVSSGTTDTWTVQHGIPSHASESWYFDSRQLHELIADQDYDSYNISAHAKINGNFIYEGTPWVFNNFETTINKSNVKNAKSKDLVTIDCLEYAFGIVGNSYHLSFIRGHDHWE